MDTDGDGISDTDEVMLYGTSPILADTDGDGFTDYDEIFLHGFDPNSTPLRFNPRVADLPELNVRFVGPPIVTLILTASNGESWTYATTQTFEVTNTLTTSVTEGQSFSNTLGGDDTISRQVAVELDRSSLVLRDIVDAGAEDGGRNQNQNQPVILDPGGPNTVTLTTGATTTIDWSNTTGVTLSFTAEQSQQLRQAITYAQSYSLSHDIAASGAILKVLVDFENVGALPVRVVNWIMSAAFLLPDGTLLPVGNLEISQEITNFYPYSLAPGGRQGPINFSNINLTLEQFELLGSNIDALQVNVGVYDIVDSTGRPYVFDAPAIISRTATLAIDYGGQRPPERLLVATNLDPARPGVTMGRVLGDILHLPYEADHERGLTAMRNVAASEGGRWTVQLRHNQSGDTVTTAFTPPYELDDILIRAGDVIQLAWSAP